VKIDFSSLYDCMNSKYWDYVEDYRRIQIFKGGAGAGKSRFIAQRQVHRLVTVPNHNGVCIRNDKTNNHASTFAELIEVIEGFGIKALFKINSAKGNESITCLLNGNKIIFRGLDDPEKIKSITIPGGGISWIWVEEASEIKESAFNQLLLRIRGVGSTPKYIILSFNPIDVDHWIKARFFDNRIDPEKGFICESTYKDNEFLTEEDRGSIEAFKDIDWYYYQVYALNQWGSITTAKVFHNLQIHDFDVEEWNFENVRAGLDFGFRHYQAFERIGFKDGELYIFGEICEKEVLNIAFAQMITQSGFPPEMMVTADSADPGAITEMNENGVYCQPAIKGPGSLEAGVKYLQRLPKIHIHKTLCPHAARTFPRFKYREDRTGKIYDNQYVEMDDDPIAAVRYATEEWHISGTDGGVISNFGKGV
jgi:phage terminase large subunit